ncbi:MAG: winged helix-turn-helix domain-containing protein, partial [Gemmatimonadales bacterium]
MISLKLFGGASLERDGAILSGRVAQRHRLALLSLLAVSHPRPLSRDKLLGYLWPERDTDHARNLLKQAVHVIRKALGEGVIRSAGDDLYFEPSQLDCDALAFEESLASGDRERAIELYAGPFLDGF